MTALNIARSEMPLEDLVFRVCYMELTECRDEAEFREGVQLVLSNLDEVLDALCFYRPPERRIQRAVDRVKLKASHMRNICTAVPESFDNPEGWRSMWRKTLWLIMSSSGLKPGCCTGLPFPAQALAYCARPCEKRHDKKKNPES